MDPYLYQKLAKLLQKRAKHQRYTTTNSKTKLNHERQYIGERRKKYVSLTQKWQQINYFTQFYPFFNMVIHNPLQQCGTVLTTN